MKIAYLNLAIAALAGGVFAQRSSSTSTPAPATTSGNSVRLSGGEVLLGLNSYLRAIANIKFFADLLPADTAARLYQLYFEAAVPEIQQYFNPIANGVIDVVETQIPEICVAYKQALEAQTRALDAINRIEKYGPTAAYEETRRLLAAERETLNVQFASLCP